MILPSLAQRLPRAHSRVEVNACQCDLEPTWFARRALAFASSQCSTLPLELGSRLMYGCHGDACRSLLSTRNSASTLQAGSPSRSIADDSCDCSIASCAVSSSWRGTRSNASPALIRVFATRPLRVMWQSNTIPGCFGLCQKTTAHEQYMLQSTFPQRRSPSPLAFAAANRANAAIPTSRLAVGRPAQAPSSCRSWMYRPVAQRSDFSMLHTARRIWHIPLEEAQDSDGWPCNTAAASFVGNKTSQVGALWQKSDVERHCHQCSLNRSATSAATARKGEHMQ